MDKFCEGCRHYRCRCSFKVHDEDCILLAEGVTCDVCEWMGCVWKCEPKSKDCISYRNSEWML
jgi:hypothetical protein